MCQAIMHDRKIDFQMGKYDSYDLKLVLLLFHIIIIIILYEQKTN